MIPGYPGDVHDYPTDSRIFARGPWDLRELVNDAPRICRLIEASERDSVGSHLPAVGRYPYLLSQRGNVPRR